MRVTLTVFFEDPFYVGIVERVDDQNRLTVARQVFGAAPSDQQLFEWVLRRYAGLRFSPPVEPLPERLSPTTPKGAPVRPPVPLPARASEPGLSRPSRRGERHAGLSAVSAPAKRGMLNCSAGLTCARKRKEPNTADTEAFQPKREAPCRASQLVKKDF